MVTHTSITDFMNMKIKQFYHVLVAVCNVMDKRNNGGG